MWGERAGLYTQFPKYGMEGCVYCIAGCATLSVSDGTDGLTFFDTRVTLPLPLNAPAHHVKKTL